MQERVNRKAVDLSHEIVDGMVTHPGIPGPVISTFLTHEASTGRYSPGTTFEIGRIDLVANTGTYLDTPAHRFPGRPDLARLDLEQIVDLDGILVDCRNRSGQAIGPEAFAGLRLSGRAVLVATGWDARWGAPSYLADNPFLTEAAARHLVDGGAALVGIDSLKRRLPCRSPAAGAHGHPRRRHPACRAPDQPRSSARRGVAILRRATADPRDGHVPGPRLRAHRLTLAAMAIRRS